MTVKRNNPSRILVVEDETAIRFLSTRALLRAGYGVDAASDGAAAWELLHRDRFDLLITDNIMPKVSGIELLRKIHGVRMTLPAIMATGSPPDHEFAASPWLRPSAILLKPYTMYELLVMVKEVLLAAQEAKAESSGEPKPPDSGHSK